MSDIAERLRKAGYEPVGEGGVALSGAASTLYRGWARFLAERFAPYYEHFMHASLFVEEEVLEKAGYLAHFPQHVFVAQGILGARHATPLPGRMYVSPAGCLHLYPGLAGRDLSAAPFAGFVVAQCARYEAGQWEYPFRVAGFNMAELVVAGSESRAGELYGEMQALVPAMFARLGFSVETRPATDSFFLGTSDGARVIQKLKELKKEYMLRVGSAEVAVASLNNHETYFSRRFAIGTRGGPPIHSFCLAFGLERLTACGLLLWGDHEKGWPRELRP
jgi:seryl-tRNA synthetase